MNIVIDPRHAAGGLGAHCEHPQWSRSFSLVFIFRQIDFVLHNKAATTIFKYQLQNMNCVIFNKILISDYFVITEKLKELNLDTKILTVKSGNRSHFRPVLGHGQNIVVSCVL